MAGKSAAMIKFVFGLVILAPISMVSGFIGLGWAWESISGCFLNLGYVCGQVEWFKAFIFIAIALGCINGIKFLWDKTK
jgi:nitrogen fixation-related uncharacterized protein